MTAKITEIGRNVKNLHNNSKDWDLIANDLLNQKKNMKHMSCNSKSLKINCYVEKIKKLLQNVWKFNSKQQKYSR